jgi:HSP20 family molecular chaperone IbpA
MASRKKEGQKREAQSEPVAKLPAEQEGGERTRSRATFRPRVDIVETDDALVLVADVPGAERDGLGISLDRRVLTVRAEIHDDAPEGMSALYREYEIGDYERRFQLAGDFDTENIEADLKNGVVTVTIRKAKQPEAKRIEVKPS